MAREETEWLAKELPKWVKKGWISNEQGDQILHYYHSDRSESHLSYVLISSIATLLIGSGLILIVANNWPGLSPGLKTIISFFPVLVGLLVFGYTQIKRYDQLAWRESGAAFLMLMLAASLGLFVQTHHVLTDDISFLRVWMVLSVPVMYLGRSTLTTLIYLGAAISLALQSGHEGSGSFWLLTGLAFPSLLLPSDASRYRIRKSVLEIGFLFCIIIGWFATVEMNTSLYGIVGTSVFLAVLWGWGIWSRHRSGARFLPTLWIPAIAIFVFIMVLTSGIEYQPVAWSHWFAGEQFPSQSAFFNGWLLCLILSSWGGFLIFAFSRVRSTHSIIQSGSDIVLLIWPLFVFVFMLIREVAGPDEAQIWMNISGLMIGVLLLMNGLQRRQYFFVNLGLLYILSLMTLRFFDQSWTLLIKGFIFIGLGMLFLAVNYWLYKKKSWKG